MSGTITCGGDYYGNPYAPTIAVCNIRGEVEAPAAIFTPPPFNTFSGMSSKYFDCRQTCGAQSEISAGFLQPISAGVLYEFYWTFAGQDFNYWYYGKKIYLPAESWDAPTCETCIGDSPMACAHPTPRSLTISPRPDLRLSSPLGDRTIERVYRTALVGDGAAGDGMFGKGWRANFEYRIGTLKGVNTYGVMLFDAAGSKTFYQRSNYPSTPMTYTSPDGRGGTISNAADGTYLWVDTQGTRYQFDAAGGIASITDVHGNRETFVSSGGRITSLTDRHGREVTFDYQGTNHVVRLLGPSTAANADGEYARYAYDTSGNLTGVTFPDGNAQNYGYENSSWPSHMTRFSLEGPQGPAYRQLFQYNAQGRVHAVSEGPEGRSYQLAYSSEQVDFDAAHPKLGKKTVNHTTVTEWTDADWDFQINGAEVQTARHIYSYENRGGAEVITKIADDGCSCAAEKEYDGAYHVVQSKDNKGVATRMTYDGAGEITSLTQAAGTVDERVTEYGYVYAAAPVFPGQMLQKTVRRQSVVSPADDTIVTEINDPATGDVQIRKEQGYRVDGAALIAETAYTYTAAGALQSVDGPRQDTQDITTYDYHPAGGAAAGMLWKITAPNGAVTTFQEYDGLGNVLRMTDANNRDTTYAYDSRGLLQARTTVEGTTRYEYDAQGKMAMITHPKGNSVSFSHGQSGPSRVADADGRIDYGYANGNVVSESVYDSAAVLERSTIFAYDDNNRLRRTTRADGNFEELLYDANGNLTDEKLYAAVAPTAPSKSTVLGYDSLNRLTSVSVAGDPYQVSYTYDAQGNLGTVVDPVGQSTRYSYDDLGRRSQIVSPETGTTAFTHDEAGNVTSRRDNLGRLISYAYDGLDRPTEITYSDASAPVRFRYDDYSSGSYPDAMGRLTEVTDDSGFRRFSYSPAGRLSKVVHTVDEREFATEYSYDANGNLESLTYPDGRTIRYEYDPLSDRVQTVTSTKNGVSAVLAERITHKPFGPLSGVDYGNGLHLANGYGNLMYRLDSLEVSGASEDVLPARGYDYDAAGSIRTIVSNLPEGIETQVFEYDVMNRLSSWTAPGRLLGFTYDANGNRQSLTADGQRTDYTYDQVARNMLASSTGALSREYVSDQVGNVAGLDARRLVHDMSNRLGSVEEGDLLLGEYTYNIGGQRTKKSVAGQATYYEYDASGRLLYEYRADGGVEVDYVYLSTEPLAMLVADNVPESSIVTPSTGAHGSLTPATAQEVEHGQAAVFTVTPDAGYHVEGISGCDGTLDGGTYTTAPVAADCTVAASFAIDTYGLAATKTGTGAGTVTSAPAGISCSSICSATYEHGAIVSLSQTSGAGSVFTGWGGDCYGTGSCAVTMTSARAVTAQFSKGITVNAPNGGELWKKNATYVIRWSYLGNPGAAVKVELLKDGALNKVIKASIPIGSGGAGSYSWKITGSQGTGTGYRIRVTSTTSGSFTDSSDADFTIN